MKLSKKITGSELFGRLPFSYGAYGQNDGFLTTLVYSCKL